MMALSANDGSECSSLEPRSYETSNSSGLWWVPGWQVEDLASDYKWLERHKNEVIEGYRQEGDRICRERNSLRRERDELLIKNRQQADALAESQAARVAAEQRCQAAEGNAEQLNEALQTDNKGRAEMAERLARLEGQLRYYKEHVDLLEDEKGSLHAMLEAYRAEHGRMESDTETALSPQLQQNLSLRFERPDSPSSTAPSHATAVSQGDPIDDPSPLEATPSSQGGSSKENRTPPGSSRADFRDGTGDPERWNGGASGGRGSFERDHLASAQGKPPAMAGAQLGGQGVQARTAPSEAHCIFQDSRLRH